MKSFKELREACWDRYTQKGMKKKGDRMVPNCVPVKEDGGAAGGGMGVGAVAGSGAASLPADQKEPGVSKKRNPVMMGIERRKQPQ
jgi:hypothetical protein